MRVRAPQSVGARLEALARERGDTAAYLDAGSTEVVTWADAALFATAWSGKVPAGTVVGLCLKSPVAFCRAYLAGLAAGICLAPLDPHATAEELTLILEILEVVDVVVDEETASVLDDTDTSFWGISPEGLRQTRRKDAARLAAPRVAALLPTSGTTGRPKVVPLTEAQLLRVAARIASHHAIMPDDRGYCPLPLFHVNAQVVGVLSTFVAGASLVVEDRFHRSEFWPKAEMFGVTWLDLVPAILGTLADEPPPASSVARRVRFARSASSPLPVAVLERFEATSGVGVLETYGMTEAASQIAANPLESRARRHGSVGLPLGVEVHLVDDDGDEVECDEIGAVEIGGPDVVEEYLGARRAPRSARNAAGRLATGDLARRDADGYLYLVGRNDEVINRGGEKCYPREIEEVLRRNALVTDAVAVGRSHPRLGAEPVAYVVTDRDLDGAAREALAGELLAECREVLSHYKWPVSIEVVDALPMGRTGKTSRMALRAAADGAISSVLPGA